MEQFKLISFIYIKLSKLIMQLWLVWCMIILLDVRLNVWAGPVIFYANSLFTLCRNKVLYHIIFIKHQNQVLGAANYWYDLHLYILDCMLRNDVSNVRTFN